MTTNTVKHFLVLTSHRFRIHWIPVECFQRPERVKQSSLADVWALATTLYEIFTYGEPISLNQKINIDYRKYYATKHILPKPLHCPMEIYEVMRECWEWDPYKRKLPQAITRDINQIFYKGLYFLSGRFIINIYVFLNR